MSARSLRLLLTPPAERDLTNLLAYAEEHWGLRQRTLYEARIESAFRELARFPALGRSLDDGPPGLRWLRVSEHVIHYRHDEHVLTVLRILHRRMEPEQHLPVE